MCVCVSVCVCVCVYVCVCLCVCKCVCVRVCNYYDYLLQYFSLFSIMAVISTALRFSYVVLIIFLFFSVVEDPQPDSDI